MHTCTHARFLALFAERTWSNDTPSNKTLQPQILTFDTISTKTHRRFSEKCQSLRLGKISTIRYWKIAFVEEHSQKDMTTSWPMSWTWAPQGSSSPPLSLECEFTLSFPLPEIPPRTQPSNGDVMLKLPAQYTWLSPVRFSQDLEAGIGDTFILLLRKTSLVYKFLLLLLKLHGVACLFLWSLPALCIWWLISDYIRKAPEKVVNLYLYVENLKKSPPPKMTKVCHRGHREHI